jgi:preprotein translocase subunit SecB
VSNNEQASIQFLNFVVKESHIVFNKLGDYKIDINFNPTGTVIKSINQFILKITVIIKDKDNGFNINLSTESVFSYSEETNVEEHVISLFSLNAPAIVFPYVRAYIASLTALSGMPLLTLPTLNLSQLGEVLKKNISIVD